MQSNQEIRSLHGAQGSNGSEYRTVGAKLYYTKTVYTCTDTLGALKLNRDWGAR